MIHKRELSDSRVESGSSLFYLLHCSAHDRLNTMTFRSFRNIPHGLHPAHRNGKATENSLPQHIPHGLHHVAGRHLHLRPPLPQHIPHGLHPDDGQQPCICHNFASAHPARIASHGQGAKNRPTHFASAHPARIASAKSHRCNATNPRNML